MTPETWSFIPDLCGGFMLSPTGDKWYPEGHEHRCVSALSLAAAEARAEQMERENAELQKDVLTLAAFRERVQSEQQIDLFDWGGCGCFTPSEA